MVTWTPFHCKSMNLMWGTGCFHTNCKIIGDNTVDCGGMGCLTSWTCLVVNSVVRQYAFKCNVTTCIWTILLHKNIVICMSELTVSQVFLTTFCQSMYSFWSVQEPVCPPPACCYGHVVTTMLWSQCCDGHVVITILWRPCWDGHVVTTLLWSPCCCVLYSGESGGGGGWGQEDGQGWVTLNSLSYHSSIQPSKHSLLL